MASLLVTCTAKTNVALSIGPLWTNLNEHSAKMVNCNSQKCMWKLYPQNIHFLDTEVFNQKAGFVWCRCVFSKPNVKPAGLAIVHTSCTFPHILPPPLQWRYISVMACQTPTIWLLVQATKNIKQKQQSSAPLSLCEGTFSRRVSDMSSVSISWRRHGALHHKTLVITEWCNSHNVIYFNTHIYYLLSLIIKTNMEARCSISPIRHTKIMFHLMVKWRLPVVSGYTFSCWLKNHAIVFPEQWPTE